MSTPSRSIKRERESARGSDTQDSRVGWPKELLLEVRHLDLSTRAAGCLARMGVRYLGDLVLLSESDLLEIRSCGRSTVDGLKQMLKFFGLSLAMEIPAWQKADVTHLARQQAAELSRIQQRWFKRRGRIDAKLGVETEISSTLAALLKPTDVARIEHWIGLDQSARQSYRATAKVFNKAGERIRQVVAKTRRKIAAVNLDMPQLRAAVDLLGRLRLTSEGGLQALLIAEGLAERQISTHGLLRAAELFRIPVPSHVKFLRVGTGSYIGSREGIRDLKTTCLVGRRYVRRWGCLTMADVYAMTKDTCRAALSVDLVEEAMAAQPGFHWLDEESGWFGLECQPGEKDRNCVLARVQKILAVAHRMEISELRAGVARPSRMQGFAPPESVLLNICKRLKQCRIEGGRTVVALRPRDLVKELSPSELTLVKVFRKHGPKLSSAEAHERCRKAGLGAATINVALYTSPILQRVGKGIFALVGS